MLDARQQIHDALLSYCRGIDRLRADDVRAGFHPAAQLDGYGPGPMTIEDFADHAVRALADRYVATQHRISNTRIEFSDDGSSAIVETYVEASHVESPGGDTPNAPRLHIFAGRYIDRCRPDDHGVWKIAGRTLRNDWSRVDTITPMNGTYVASGRGGTPDPLFDD